MAIQKNFVVKNGLEVNTDLILADVQANKVGIGTTVPYHKLHVYGGIGVTNSIVTGICTVNDLIINGKITAGSSTGVPGQYLVSTSDGVTWSPIPKLRTVDSQIASIGSTVFNTSYSVGLLDVYINGVRLSDSEFTAIDSATVSLNDPCFGGETIEFVSYSITGVGVGVSGIQGITILDEGSPVGTPLQVTSINFVGGAVTSVGAGYGVTVYLSDYVSFSGISTYSDTAGISSFSSASGYSDAAGISSYSSIAGYSDTAGISTDVIGGIVSVTSVTAGVVTATDGFISVGNTTPIQISLIGDQLTFTAVGIGSTTLTLF